MKRRKIKMIKLPKIKMETVLTLGGIGLGVAQMLLNSKKEANDKAALKAEILEELTKDLTLKKD